MRCLGTTDVEKYVTSITEPQKWGCPLDVMLALLHLDFLLRVSVLVAQDAGYGPVEYFNPIAGEAAHELVLVLQHTAPHKNAHYLPIEAATRSTLGERGPTATAIPKSTLIPTAPRLPSTT